VALAPTFLLTLILNAKTSPHPHPPSPNKSNNHPTTAHARLLLAEGLLPTLYTSAFKEASEASNLQASFRSRGRHLLLQPRDLERMASAVRPPPVPPPPTAVPHAAGVNTGLAPPRTAASDGLPRSLLLRAAESLPGRLFAAVGGVDGSHFSFGGSSGRRRSSGGAGGEPRRRAPQLLPNIERCGDCHTCQNLSLKKACVRNKVRMSPGWGGGLGCALGGYGIYCTC